MSEQVYIKNYPGYFTMKWHDDEQNELKRWFDNYKIDRYAYFLTDIEWLVVKEVPTNTKGKDCRYIVEIGSDHNNARREIVMDHSAPKPPLMSFAAKRKYVAPLPKTAYELMMEEMQWRRDEMFYRQMQMRNYYSPPMMQKPPEPPKYRRNA